MFFGGLLLVRLLLSFPDIQVFLAEKVSKIISKELECKVNIKSLDASSFSKITLDDIIILDQASDTLLSSSRIAAKVQLSELINGRFVFDYLQLYKPNIRIHKKNNILNIQFLIDKFSSDNSDSKSNTFFNSKKILLRRGFLMYNSESVQHKIDNISVTLSDLKIDNDKIYADLSDLHCKYNELKIVNIHALVKVNVNTGEISDFDLTLPESRLHFCSFVWDDNMNRFKTKVSESHISPIDIKSLFDNSNSKVINDILDVIPALDLGFEIERNNDTINIKDAVIDGGSMKIKGNLTFTLSPFSVVFNDLNIHTDEDFFNKVSGLFVPEYSMHIPVDITANGCYSKKYTELKSQIKTAGTEFDLTCNIISNEVWGAKLRTNDAYPYEILKNLPFLPESTKESLNADDKININIEARGNLKHKEIESHIMTSCISKILDADVIGDFYYGDSGQPRISTSINIRNINPSSFGFSGRLSDFSYALNLDANLACSSSKNIEHPTGSIVINNFEAYGDTAYTKPLIKHMVIDMVSDSNNISHIKIFSDFLNASALVEGNISNKFKDIKHILSNKLAITKSHLPSNTIVDNKSSLIFSSVVNNADLLNIFANTNIKLTEPFSISLIADSTIKANITAPDFSYNSTRFTNSRINISMDEKSIDVASKLGIHMNSSLASIDLNAHSVHNNINFTLAWDSVRQKIIDTSGKLVINVNLDDTIQIGIDKSNSSLCLNGEQWSIKEGQFLILPDKTIRISDFTINNGEQSRVSAHGILSKTPTDTLYANIRNFRLGYIFNLVNFHSVLLDGNISGDIIGTELLSKPVASGLLDINNFTFNSSRLGDLRLDAGWNTKTGILNLDGTIKDEPVQCVARLGKEIPVNTHIYGYLDLLGETKSCMDLNIKTEGFNLGFLNYWTQGIFDNLNGAASGFIRIYGPFSGIDLEGLMRINHCTTVLPYLGVGFQLAGDMVRITPGCFEFCNAKLYENSVSQPQTEHVLNVTGKLTHSHFGKMKYKFDAEANNMLLYDTKKFGNEDFFGTAYLTGDIKLRGEYNLLNVEVNGHTMPGSRLVYNIPKASTISNSSELVTFRSSSQHLQKLQSENKSTEGVTRDETSDLRLHLNIDVTPDAELRVLMDEVSGDYIQLFGNSHLRASYFNKGAFQMYGTYNVARGLYHMTLQNIIRKDFVFASGSRIIFSGIPSQAQLDLQAQYQLSGVSLADLSSNGNFENSRTKVNCLMNISGNTERPTIAFDIDLPNANSDEINMVKALISTEEERNLQAIYLLGLGRFYSLQEQSDTQSNTSTNALNGLLSSTLSAQFNDILSNAIGSKNFTIGTNLSTGQMGWNEIQAEGQLSGRMFNDRLNFNGSFGYRESIKTAYSGFVGDFDLQWLLNKRRTIAIKAYSQTTDRYFTKSSLRTQGVGIVFKKDFDNLYELFNLKRKNKTK